MKLKKINKVYLSKSLRNLLNDKFMLLILLIFLCELFLRFYQLDIKSTYGWDQVDNSWAAKNLIVNHELPLVGMVAKGNSGIYIGPFYYYLISIVYFVTNLNPIASSIFAGLTSIFTFWTIYFVFRRLFSKEVAFFGLFLNTFLMPAIIFDRVQWPVNLIPSISLLIFYVLFRITQGEYKKIIHLAMLVGFSFSVHFTSVFYPLIIILSLPFFPRNKETLKYILLSIPIFIAWLIPNILYQLQQKSGSFSSYFGSYFHGFHLRRVIQIAGDGLIQFNPYLYDKIYDLKFVALPIFFLTYLYKSMTRKNLVFCYLVLLWFIVPWFSFATYSGEISDYYFAINRFIALLVISYMLWKFWSINNLLPKAIIAIVLAYLLFVNLTIFKSYKEVGLYEREKAVKDKIDKGIRIEFEQGVPDSYLYYYYMRQKGINVY